MAFSGKKAGIGTVLSDPGVGALMGGLDFLAGDPKTSEVDYGPLRDFLPPELFAIFGSPEDKGYAPLSTYDTPLGRALSDYMDQINKPGLPAGVRERTLSAIAQGGEQTAEAFSANQAMTGMGFSPAIGQGIARQTAQQTAGAEAQLGMMQRSGELANLSLLMPLLGFFSNIQSTRFGAPYGQTASGTSGMENLMTMMKPMAQFGSNMMSTQSSAGQQSTTATQATPSSTWSTNLSSTSGIGS